MKAKSNEKFSETFYSLMKIVNKYDGDLSERLDLKMREGITPLLVNHTSKS